MEGRLKWIEKMQFAAQIREHSFLFDTTFDFGGTNSAPTPMEALLMSIAGCTAMDIVHILKKQRQSLKEFRIDIKGTRRDKHPKAFNKIEIKYIFKGENLTEKGVERAIKLSEEKYCSAMELVRPKAEIITTYVIEP